MSFGPITRPSRRRKIVTYDLEWVPGDYSPVKHGDPEGWEPMALRLLGVYDARRGYRAYTNVRDFFNAELTSENDGAWFYAHLGGLADIQYLFDFLVRNQRPQIRVSAAFAGSSVIVMRIQRGGRSWYFVDSFRLLPTKLREIAKWVDMAKGGADGDRSTFFAPIKELREYNELDCLILHRAVSMFEAYLLSVGGQLEKTVAASALSLFRRSYQKREIRTVPNVNVIARQAYIASRVEVFAYECQQANYYDINSSFPHAMTFDAPGNFLRRVTRLPDPDRALYLAELTVTVPDCEIPPLPYRGGAGRIFFPVGTWRAWFCEADVSFVLECGGTIEAVHDVLTFEPFHDLSDYSRDLYERRRTSQTPAEKQVWKFLLNSIYGKFGEREEKEKLLINPITTSCSHTPRCPDDGCMRMVRPGVWLMTETADVAHAHVPIAARITAVARTSLGRYLRQCERVYYCDTDGFVTTSEFPIGDELGALKLEKLVVQGRFVAPKLYKYQAPGGDWTVKSKGFSRLTSGEFDRLTGYTESAERVEREEVAIMRMARIRENLAYGDTTPREKSIAKGIRDGLRPKRRHYADGTSRPWTVAELNHD